MSKVLVDRELLERMIQLDSLGLDAQQEYSALRAILAQPAEAEGVGRNAITEEVKSAYYERKSITEAVDAICAALSAVTAERDALAARLGEWERSTLAQIMRENVELTAERDRLREDISQVRGANKILRTASDMVRDERDQLRAEAEALRKDAVRWRYVRLQGDDTHWLNLLRVDLEDFGGNINAAVDALIDGDTPAMAAKEA